MCSLLCSRMSELLTLPPLIFCPLALMSLLSQKLLEETISRRTCPIFNLSTSATTSLGIGFTSSNRQINHEAHQLAMSDVAWPASRICPPCSDTLRFVPLRSSPSTFLCLLERAKNMKLIVYDHIIYCQTKCFFFCPLISRIERRVGCQSD